MYCRITVINMFHIQVNRLNAVIAGNGGKAILRLLVDLILLFPVLQILHTGEQEKQSGHPENKMEQLE